MQMPESPSISEIQFQNIMDLPIRHTTENIPSDNTKNSNSSSPNPSPPLLVYSHEPLLSTTQQQRQPLDDGKPLKRHLSDSSSLEVNSIAIHNSDLTTPNLHSDSSKKIQKKVKVRSRSNSASRKEDKILESLTPAKEIFLNNTNVTMLQFKYVLENYTNKNINIHTLCKDIDSNIPSLMQLIEDIRPKINKTFLKTHLTKLGNLLFQASPPQDS